jgi:hypothetical protein
MLKSKFMLGAVPVAVVALAACSHTTTREIVTPTPVTTAAPPTVVVANAQTPATTAPPAPRAEVRPPSPGVNYVWQDGYWSLNNGQYEWVPGYWVVSRSGATRVPQRWESDGMSVTPNGGPN